INNGNISYNKSLLYMVITQPGSTDPAEGLLGNHSTDTASNNRGFYYGWVENVGGTKAMDDITEVFSHEDAEAVTDPDGRADQIDPRNQKDAKGNISWNEISDGEAQNYTFRVNNYLLQAYYSQRDAAYVVPNGSTNNFLVSSTGVLTLQGSFGGLNDIEVNRINGG